MGPVPGAGAGNEASLCPFDTTMRTPLIDLNSRLSSGGVAVALLLTVSACERGLPPSKDAPWTSGGAPTASPSANATSAPAASVPTGPDTRAAARTPLVITQAQIDAEHSPDLAACLDTGDAARGVSVAMGGCFNRELSAQDARLNSAYRDAMARLDETGRAKLRLEERAWIRERDNGCREAATGGTIDLVEIPGCLLEETVRRRLELEAMAQ
ncbi:hypothetical protein BH10PSE1_BH10PSE1_24690 [soil metagenome]